MKLSEKVAELEFSSAEIARLSGLLLSPSSAARDVFEKYPPKIRDVDFWARAHRKFKLNGFRPGSSQAISKILTRALDSLRSGTERSSTWKLVEPLYGRAVQLYFQEKHPQLNEVLLQEDFEPSPGTETDQIFRVISRAMAGHEVSEDSVRELYDLWGFERTDLLDKILQEAGTQIGSVQKLVAKKTELLRQEIMSELALANSRQGARLREVSNVVSEVQQLAQRMQSQLATLEGEIRERAQDATKPAPTRQIENTLSRTGSARSGRHNTHLLQVLEETTRRVESLGRQVKELRTLREDVRPTPEIRVGAVSQTSLALQKKWSASLALMGLQEMSVESVWVLLEMIRRSPVLLVDSMRILDGLFNVENGCVLKAVAAAPNWVDTTRLESVAAFLDSSTAEAKCLVVNDFDVAFQELYLVPFLTNWISAKRADRASRIVLVPREPTLADVSHRVLEMSLVLSKHSSYFHELHNVARHVSKATADDDMAHPIVDLLKVSVDTRIDFEQQIYQLAANRGVFLPARLLTNCVNLFCGLRTRLPEREALFVAQEASILPWVERARGAPSASLIREALKFN